MDVKAISFDFDGVFVRDSEAVFKQEAWARALDKYKGQYEKYLKEAKSIYGYGKKGGRREMFEYVFEKIGEPKEEIDSLIVEALETFDFHVQSKIVESGLVPGALETLNDIFDRGLPMYLNSGTETEALKQSTKNLGVEHFFKEIMGSTRSKIDNLRHISDVEGAEMAEIFVVGDGQSDYRAAKELGCFFIGVSNIWNKWQKGGESFEVIENLNELPDLLDA